MDVYDVKFIAHEKLKDFKELKCIYSIIYSRSKMSFNNRKI